MLIEDPGPWGYDALRYNRVPPELFAEIKSWADSVFARVVLVRRGARLVGTPRKIFVASSKPDSAWLTSATADDLADLTSVDRVAFERGEVPGDKIDGLYLICTHGRHDRCCSIRGNPVARALCAKYGDTAWECSHIGGDRFAANVVCLPRGAYFGRVSPSGADKLTDDYARGILDLDLFRGFSWYPFAVQAAEISLRRNLGLTGTNDVIAESWTKPRATEVAVRLATPDHGAIDVTVEVKQNPDEFYLTCRAQQPGRPPLFETTL